MLKNLQLIDYAKLIFDKLAINAVLLCITMNDDWLVLANGQHSLRRIMTS